MGNLFDALDLDCSDAIEFDEFLSIAEQKEVRMWMNSLDIETDDLAALFQLIDGDASGSVTRDEMITKLPRLRGTARGIDVIVMARNLKKMWENSPPSAREERHEQLGVLLDAKVHRDDSPVKW